MTRKKRVNISDMIIDDVVKDVKGSEENTASVIGLVGPDDSLIRGDDENTEASNLWKQLNNQIAGKPNVVKASVSKPVEKAPGKIPPAKPVSKMPLGKEANERTKTIVPPPFVEKDDKTEALFSPPLLPETYSTSVPSASIPKVSRQAFERTEPTHTVEATSPILPADVPVEKTEVASRNSSVINMQTVAVPSSAANAKSSGRRDQQRVVKTEIAVKVNSVEASLLQSENLRLAQEKIELMHQDLEALRIENDELATSAELFKNRIDDLDRQLQLNEKLKKELEETLSAELLFVRSNAEHKERELVKLREKNQELDSRIHNELRKVKVRERELENRLELLKQEKNAIVRTKDETILELKRQIDRLEIELGNYKRKTIELVEAVDGNQDQMRRTVRALRIALNHLESNDDLTPLKKAE